MARIPTEQLIKECQSAGKATAGKQSSLVRVRGRPVPAPKGAVGLQIADGSTAVILASDIVETDRLDDGEYEVGLAIDTDVLVARTFVRRAFEVSTGKEGGCGCLEPAAMARPFGWGGLGGCIAHCNALESFCMGGSGGGIILFSASTTAEDLQDALLKGARCRDIWQGCASRCFDATFSRSMA